jgi:pimeloyl-ACP methyl ester carboxylesterase
LVAVGEHDEWATPAQHIAIAQAISGATITIIPDAGHMVPVEQPDRMTDALTTWLTSI